jgi:hypothetical protein
MAQSNHEGIVRRRILQALFALPLGVPLFWAVGLAWDLAFGWDPDPLKLFIVSCLLGAGASYAVFHVWPHALLVPVHAGWGMLVGELVTAVLHAYVGWAVLIGALGSGLLALGLISGRDSSTFVILMTVWFPLWLMVPTACMLTSRRLRRRLDECAI